MAENKIERFKDILRCVSCHSQLQKCEKKFICKNCNTDYQITNNKSVVFITDEEELNSNKIERPILDYGYGQYETMILNEHPGEIIIEVGVGGHQLPCFGLHEILVYYFQGINDPKIARKIQKMSVKKFMNFLQDCKSKYTETHLNSKTIENIAAGVFFYGKK